MSSRSVTLEGYVRLGALRWLHGLDLNPDSRTYGVADREYWSWKTKDFANGTFQGGIAGFVDALPLLEMNSLEARKVVSACLKGSRFIQRGNGTFEEAYPFESSYAVTGLVVFNLLYSYFRRSDLFGGESVGLLRDICEPAIRFLKKTPETHGLISNHVCTTKMACLLGERFLDSLPATSYQEVLDLQESEGWFPEYDGADPGYQTLLNHYLLATLVAVKESRTSCDGALSKSIDFIEKFCFPNGTFAGEIGSRGTSIVYPSGTLLFLRGVPTPSRSSFWFLSKYLDSVRAVSPVTVDPGNFVPVFNSWSLAWALGISQSSLGRENQLSEGRKVWSYEKAGLRVARSSVGYIAVSLKLGTLRKTELKNEEWVDTSLVDIVDDLGNHTQGTLPMVTNVGSERVKISFGSRKRSQVLNTPLRAIAVRFFGILFYRLPILQRILKRILVRIVMGGGAKVCGDSFTLSIDFGQDDFPVEISGAKKFQKRSFGFLKHMASANTFDERTL